MGQKSGVSLGPHRRTVPATWRQGLKDIGGFPSSAHRPVPTSRRGRAEASQKVQKLVAAFGRSGIMMVGMLMMSYLPNFRWPVRAYWLLDRSRSGRSETRRWLCQPMRDEDAISLGPHRPMVPAMWRQGLKEIGGFPSSARRAIPTSCRAVFGDWLE
jgi:hypothetical protein